MPSKGSDAKNEENRSLNRLKKLKDIKDVDEQLAEATALCNHMHRADMTLRWLLGSIKRCQLLRSRSKAWKLLEKCSRLLVPVRLASLLKNTDLFESIIDVLPTEGNVDFELTSSIKNFLALLLSISESTRGKALLQTLSLSSGTAARFLGKWFLAIWSLSHTPDRSYSYNGLSSLAIRIWNLRQKTDTDDQNFVKHAWFECGLLLSQPGALLETDAKRGRDSTITMSSTHSVKKVEEMIAKHVYLPARSTFFSSNNKVSDSDQASAPTDQIRANIKFLTQRIDSLTDIKHGIDMLRPQLTIAMRCTPLVNQRQKRNEVRWNDAVLSAIIDECWIPLQGPKNHMNEFICLLDDVEDRLGFSTNLLANIILKYAPFTTLDESGWHFIEAVLRKDNEVFTRQAVYETLIPALVKSQHRHLDIVSLLAKAFAINRLLPEFLASWRQALAAEDIEELRSSMPSALDTCLEGLIEGLTVEQIQHQLHACSDTLRSLETSDQDSQSTLCSITLLCSAVLRNCNSLTQSAIASIASQIMEQLLQLIYEGSVRDTMIPGLWMTVLRCFEISFPQQVMNDPKASHNLADMALRLAPALVVAQTRSERLNESDTPAWFCGRICSILQHYPKHNHVAAELMHSLLRSNEAGCCLVVSCMPDLCNLFEASQQDALLRYDKIDGSSAFKLQDVVIDERILSDLRNEIVTDEKACHGELFKIIAVPGSNVPSKVKWTALRSLTSIVKNSPHLINQYAVEQIIDAIDATMPAKYEKLLWADMCNLLTALLLTQRTKLNGRFHILLIVLQNMLARVLAPYHQKSLKQYALGPLQAQKFTRVITLLCNPPQTRRHHKKDGQDLLVDEARRAKEKVGSFISVLVHSYCTLVLRAPPREGIREALLPALYAMLDAMEVHSIDSIKVLSAAMNNNERAILRSLVDEWRRTAKWHGS